MSSSAGEFVHRLRLRTSSAEDAIVIRRAGRLTSEHTEQLREEFMRVLPRTKRIVLDHSNPRQYGQFRARRPWFGSKLRGPCTKGMVYL